MISIQTDRIYTYSIYNYIPAIFILIDTQHIDTQAQWQNIGTNMYACKRALKMHA